MYMSPTIDRITLLHIYAWDGGTTDFSYVHVVPISRFDMSCAQAPWVDGSKPIRRVMQLKLHKLTMAIGYSLRMCARHVD